MSLRSLLFVALLVVNFFVVPAATADSDDTLFGNRSETTPIAPAAPNATAAVQTLRTEFDALNKKCADLFIEAMRPYDRQDTNNLELLQKRVGASDIDLLKKIQEALSAVASGASFEVDGLAEKKKPTIHERSLVTLKIARDQNIVAAQRNASLRSKSAYEALLKRAIAANEFELAKEIQAQMLAFTAASSPVGTWLWAPGQGNRVVIKGDGTIWHEDGNRQGKWKQIATGEFTMSISKGNVNEWRGSTWRISADGKILKRTDSHSNWRLFRK
jgi:hypothetical protein